ncbi:hypothetical protein SBF1_4220003 [Candidatus Desulfosporosinus infrequens]|uniref:HPt domain-containing protein n=1 Tax=Candidatus Desulfosporosinus infrequens TaxID=2043169 RepID=A0A2U3LA32_9FIRM|nr:hypothetical protein SBF1_4220003 [Candidatus Desulfosporosinus infrequens]
MDDELKSVFIIETEDMLLEATNLLLVEDQPNESLARINHVFRVVHSIKGGSQFLGLEELAELSHHMEDLLGPLRSGELSADEGITTLMLEALELMETQLQYVRSGEIITTQDFERKKKLIAKIARIHQPELLPEKVVPLLPVSAGSSDFVGKRLVYIHVQMEVDSIMPQLRQFLLLELLSEIGKVVYSLPSLEGLEMPGNSFAQDELAIVLSTDETDEIIRKTCDVGDISEIVLVSLDKGLSLNAPDKMQLPTAHEVRQFEQIVTRLLKEFRQDEYSQVEASALIRALDIYGNKTEVATESWFPGGLAGWQRQIRLLDQTTKMARKDRENMATCILQGFWESVYDVLCNKVYFYTETMAEKVTLSTSIFKERLAMNEEEPQLAVLDLSQMRVLEPADILILQNLAASLSLKCARLALVSSGANTRRQVNVLEASALFAKGLRIFPNAFHASFG